MRLDDPHLSQEDLEVSSESGKTLTHGGIIRTVRTLRHPWHLTVPTHSPGPPFWGSPVPAPATPLDVGLQIPTPLSIPALGPTEPGPPRGQNGGPALAHACAQGGTLLPGWAGEMDAGCQALKGIPHGPHPAGRPPLTPHRVAQHPAELLFAIKNTE